LGVYFIIKFKYRTITKNNNAISEEFTSIPSLSIILIGFTVFFLLISNVYSAYDLRTDSIDMYQKAEFIANKITNPNCFFINPGGIVNLTKLNTNNGQEDLLDFRSKLSLSKTNFTIKISWDDNNEYFPGNIPDYVHDRIAVTENICIYLNEAETSPGKITIILWSEE